MDRHLPRAVLYLSVVCLLGVAWLRGRRARALLLSPLIMPITMVALGLLSDWFQKVLKPESDAFQAVVLWIAAFCANFGSGLFLATTSVKAGTEPTAWVIGRYATLSAFLSWVHMIAFGLTTGWLTAPGDQFSLIEGSVLPFLMFLVFVPMLGLASLPVAWLRSVVSRRQA